MPRSGKFDENRIVVTHGRKLISLDDFRAYEMRQQTMADKNCITVIRLGWVL